MALDDQMNPLFLFALPRSGSTLVQRVLASAPAVSTVPEPWVLLPLTGMRRDETYAEYGHTTARRAINEFVKRMDGGIEGFEEELRRFVLRLYKRAGEDGARYFLDKTPRYHTLAPKLLELFPEAKAIILWRNPLSIAASMMETWDDGQWNLFRYRLDLYQGLPTLVDLARQQRKEIITVRYEDLVQDGFETWERICKHLGIDSGDLERSPSCLGGSVGDPKQEEYDEISSDPVEKWRNTLRNPLRKHRMRRYLRWLGSERLEIMGYSLEELERDLCNVPTTSKYMASDVIWMGLGLIHPLIEHYIFQDKFSKKDCKNVISHY